MYFEECSLIGLKDFEIMSGIDHPMRMQVVVSGAKASLCITFQYRDSFDKFVSLCEINWTSSLCGEICNHGTYLGISIGVYVNENAVDRTAAVSVVSPQITDGLSCDAGDVATDSSSQFDMLSDVQSSECEKRNAE